MGATSVTGVGHGSVEGKDMGRKQHTLGANRLIGPRIVAAGFIAGAALPATVRLPYLAAPVSPVDTYAVMVTDNTSVATISGVLTFPTANGVQDTQLVIAGTTGHDVSWAIIKTGLMP